MPSKDGWTHERDHDKVTLGRKQYRNMEEWSRHCCVCGDKFFIHVRQNETGALSSNFGLRTCKEHRGQKVAGGGDEYAQILQERNEAWTLNAQLMQDNAELRKRLAVYELPAALGQLQNVTTTNGALHSKAPWD